MGCDTLDSVTAKKRPTAKKKTKKKNVSAGRSSAERKLVKKLREYALSLPAAHEDYPWDHAVAKIGKKVFVFLDQDHAVGDKVKFSVKLPRTADLALALPFATPTGYGMGKYGWVSFSFSARDAPPLPMMCEWIEESYRAIAPKKKIAELDAR